MPKENQATAKITYATTGAEQANGFHEAYDRAIEQVGQTLGRQHPMYIDGQHVLAKEQFNDRSPIDTRITVGAFQKATREHVKDAIIAARQAYPEWSRRPWNERVTLMRKAADVLRAHRYELAVAIAFDAGKNRLECLGDVEESADFIDYYCSQMEEHNGFTKIMAGANGGEKSISAMRPLGVWAVISPFNFPLALATGPSSAALIAGNTVVFKPASETAFVGVKLYEVLSEAGLPPGVFNLVTGSGGVVGGELVENSRVDGIVFTGSKEVGMGLARESAARSIPRPVITEMGGKNPAIIMPSANVERAAEGVLRSAFGAQGQKCSACSRVYVARDARRRFVEALVEKTKKITIGNPLEKDVWLGPVINEAALATYQRAIEQAKADGGRILTGGHRLTGGLYDHGYYVEPTVIDNLPNAHSLFSEELFVPITVVSEVLTLEEAVELANRTEYGLTAGIFSEEEKEIEFFFDHIEAGVVYANRSAGITTGAWPGINPFGGWKASGSTGRGAGGPHYLQQFLREQSRLRVT